MEELQTRHYTPKLTRHGQGEITAPRAVALADQQSTIKLNMSPEAKVTMFELDKKVPTGMAK